MQKMDTLDWLLLKERELRVKANAMAQEAEMLGKVSDELAALRINSDDGYCDWCGRHASHGIIHDGAHAMYCDRCAPHVEAMLLTDDERVY